MKPGRRATLWASAALLAITAAAQLTSALQENQTFDEAVHLAAGYSYLRTGDYRLNPEHPPLLKMLCAAPLLFTNAGLPLEHPSWQAGDQYEFGQQFLYKNTLPADRLLLLGRLPAILITLLLGIAIAWWTRAEYGAAASLLALFFFATDPNFIAHGRYVTNDTIAALGFFLSIVTWIRCLRVRTFASMAIAGLALGFALLSKFSMVILPPLLALIYVIHDRERLSPRFAAAAFLSMLAIATALIWAIYIPEARRVEGPRPAPAPLRIAGRELPLPAHPFVRGAQATIIHSAEGHSSYLLGKQSQTGWWYYFPVAFAVKTPAVALALSLLALVWRPSLYMLLPAGVYFGLSMTSGINIGLRHLLPVYPFLFVMIGSAFARLPWRGLWLLAIAIQLMEVGSVHPHYLAFFNRPSGGPLAGPRYLVDSNIDWGQDLKKLKRYMADHKLDSVCLAYFGSGDPAYYGIGQRFLPWSSFKQELADLDCIGVISVTLLQDVYIPPGSFAWLRERKPIDHVGYSLWVYDLRKQR